VWGNCYEISDAAVPFGGFRILGQGRELGERRLDADTGWTTVTVLG
jgi:hypothetical protein